MPYVSKALLGRALEALRGQHPLVLFTVPAMTRAGVPAAASQLQAEQNAVEFRGAQEKALMDEFFKVDGADPERPLFPAGSRRLGSGEISRRDNPSATAHRPGEVREPPLLSRRTDRDGRS